ncbi:DNA polymerase III subunit epsilon [Candidatus Falkowbacteria bacterium RIFOXYB2_FULL_34_18]|uniref:DNA polymerase III subunit epsilon n=1 Tax=Candidatus Falkowbacteria bacterium RIFOXYD2_FULL_34_120 TaxID=1798007 RepID=A0A1F5TNP1_9BACT|nr:MAG: DNA polymerase III subunit epsilon [Candidatus Falkowbacteria bacterium RIFOXYB2_FULL_34_18]OGF28855.1 MAG: DNA polymerase III subunit epsilon [Candidatus Falkowbacteria bacterium RIFOXYC12_FULL_34_55]OGF35772.1 MAG: DNA polymerase III subunit epsilon [Candidatus Falkowbacteria bacterium RIFOXYC2_FULL_34_220]OGF38438.1 MAG: DNA polymerase III subunit epsilon [Candidatus Falkowbacteria bacterium RIFOXYD12_FULL_34_57]OGF40506.1 MAG: DNA polymerase III subunit epsilon [Candidatus Falkowbac
MFLFFDTETTGLPRRWQAPISDTNNWPRMVQLAWIVFDNDGKEIMGKNRIIKPEGYIIPADVSRIHGITTEIAEKEGILLKKALQEFIKGLQRSEIVVAHNINFDEKILGAELFRKQINTDFFERPQICTMRESTQFCRIRSGRGGYKWPKLTELHQILFGEDFDDAHDAFADVKATARCFFELRKRGVV